MRDFLQNICDFPRTSFCVAIFTITVIAIVGEVITSVGQKTK